MPILPIIDLLIFVGWTVLSIGAVLKAIYLTTSYRPTFLGLDPMELLLSGGVCLLFSLALAARTWVKANEPRMLAGHRNGVVPHEAFGEVPVAAERRRAARDGGATEVDPQEVRGDRAAGGG